MLHKLRKILEKNSESGAIHLIAILFLLLAGVAIGVGVIQQRTSFLPFAQQATDEKAVNRKSQQGFYLSHQFSPPNMWPDVTKELPYPYIVGNEIKVAVSVATDPQPVWGFLANISYPKDNLEVVNIHTKPLPDAGTPVPPKTCKDDTQCRPSEYCEGVSCIALEGVKCPEEGFCFSREGKLCTENIPCGTGFTCDMSERPEGGLFGKCKAQRGTIQEGQSCKITNDCAKGLSCIQKQLGSSEGVCQKEPTNNRGELTCQSDNDCASGHTCEEIRGSSSCSADGSACTDDYVLNGKFCSPSNQVNESAGTVETTSAQTNSDQQVCAQVITRACTYDNVKCAKAPCPPQKICKNFPTPCDVPPGWTKESEEAGKTRGGESGVGEGGGCAKNSDCQQGLICGIPDCAKNGGTCNQGTVCQKPGNSGVAPSPQPNGCAVGSTRACRTWVSARTKDCPKDNPNCNVLKLECQYFSSPCDVPEGWEIQKKEKLGEGKKVADFFITEWLDKSFDNNQGHVWLHGNTKNPGIQTNQFGNRPIMATITFKLKKAGKVNVKVSEGSMSAQDNVTANIDKGELLFTIIEQGQSFEEYIPEQVENAPPPNIVNRLTGVIRKLLFGNN